MLQFIMREVYLAIRIEDIDDKQYFGNLHTTGTFDMISSRMGRRKKLQESCHTVTRVQPTNVR